MLIIKTNIDFVNYLYDVLKKKTVYMWGGYGKLVTKDLVRTKARQYPSHYPKGKVKYLNSLVGKDYYSYDCAGLIKSYWMSEYGTKPVKYMKKYDRNAYGITIGLATKKGDIKTIPEIPGIFLYMKGHCGVYVGNGKVIECTSSKKISGKKYGCVCTSKLSDRKWTTWTMCKWLDYQVQITYVVKKGDTLSKIAKKYHTTWKKLYEKNKDIISNPNKIYPGQIINI